MDGYYSWGRSAKNCLIVTLTLLPIVHLLSPSASVVDGGWETPAEFSASYRHRDVKFLAFLPCVSHLSEDVEVTRTIEECDLLSHVAVSLAVERVNEDSGVLANRNLSVTTLADCGKDSDVSWRLSGKNWNFLDFFLEMIFHSQCIKNSISFF